MGVVKLKNEKKTITFFIITTFVVFVLSIFFLLSSIKKDELGGSFISAMLLFISGYGLIVFMLRAVRYNFVTKLQNAVLNEGVRDIETLSEKFEKRDEKIEKEVQFLIDNGYLGEFEIVGDRLVNVEEERLRLDRLHEEYKKSREVKVDESKEKANKNPQKSKISSEKCPNCGAKVKFYDGSAFCPYCGNTLTKE